MYNIKELKYVLPIRYEEYELDLIEAADIDWYINNCKSAYYEKYMDFKFSTEISFNDARKILKKVINQNNNLEKNGAEGRLLLKNHNTKDIIGGCTLIERDNDIEIAYFIVPEYSSKGMCTTMIRNVINTLNKSDMKFNRYIITVRIDNKASLNVAKKLGFSVLNTIKGKYKTNIIMGLIRNYEYNKVYR